MNLQIYEMLSARRKDYGSRGKERVREGTEGGINLARVSQAGARDLEAGCCI